MRSAAVKALTTSEIGSAADTLVLAFAADPVTRWTWRHARQYLEIMPHFVRAFGGRAFEHGGAFGTDDYAGVALWLPPDVHPDEETLGEVVGRSMAPSLAPDAAALFAQMATYHPKEPHWYLPLIGVDPAYQGKGHGDALMTHALQACDRDHVPAYLESTNRRNISLYRRHGFEPLGAIQAGSSPTLTPMLRPAR